MRRLLLAVLLIGTVLPTTSCGGDDPSPVFVDLRWQVRCISDTARGCLAIPMRDINNLDGEDDHRLSCTISQTAEGNQLLNFSAFKSTDYGIRLMGAVFTPGGGPIMGSGCVVRFEEGGTEYVGQCTSSPPPDPPPFPMTSANPCQLAGVMIEDVPGEGPTITGNIRCLGTPARADASIQRDLTGIGTGAEGDMSSAMFRIVNCRGL